MSAVVSDAEFRPRAGDGRAPDVFQVGRWIPMKEYPEDEAVDFAIVGTGCGGARARRAPGRGRIFRRRLRCRRLLPSARGLRLRRARAGKALLARRPDFRRQMIRSNSAPTIPARPSAGRPSISRWSRSGSGPEWFKSRSLLGYGHDWPVDWREMWHYYAQAEKDMSISGPVRYPWGPKRGRYPFREHELSASALVLAHGAEALGVEVGSDPDRHAFGAARQGPSLRLPRLLQDRLRHQRQAVHAGDLCPARAAGRGGDPRPRHGRPRGDRQGRARHRRALPSQRQVALPEGEERRRRRLFDRDAAAPAQFGLPRHPDGLGNSSGLVGKGLMAHTNNAVWGIMEEEIRWYKGPPSLAVCEHWNYEDRGKDFQGGYAFMSQGPAADRLRHHPGHQRGPLRRGTAELDGALQPHGRAQDRRRDDAAGRQLASSSRTRRTRSVCRFPKVTFSLCDNDKRLAAHAEDFLNRHASRRRCRATCSPPRARRI